ncbi:MAG TPA: ABC transporter ATP-binding protein [Clostridiales bacterium]|nr:ABC transporter ATP-binding protein [Clostridiales bacterium]
MKTSSKKSSSKIIKRVLSYTKPYMLYIVGAVLCAGISVSLTLLAPVLVGRAIDNIIGEGNVDFNSVATICIIIVGTIIGVAIFQWLMGVCTNKVGYHTVSDMRKDLFKKLNSMPLSFIDRHPHGDIISRIVNDTDAVGDGLLQGFTQLFSGIITIIGTLAFMIAINYKIALIVFFITPLSLFVATFIAKLSKKMFNTQSRTQGEISTCIEEMVGNQKLIVAFSYENESQKKFQAINSRLYECGEKAQFASSLANPSTRFVNAIVYAAVGVIGALSAISGTMTIGTVSCFLTYANQYTKPFNEVTGVIGQIQTALSGASRIFTLLDMENETADNSSAINMETCNGNIKIDNVSFSYTPEQRLIKDFSLSVKSGQKVAIVGPTGCGKTTLINLLMRFYDVTSGTITIDGVDIRNITRSSLRHLYGMVLQESWLYSGTIRDNIAYGTQNAADEDIVNAAKSAYAHDFISRMEKGYDTVITEDGGNLSQGQKQLLCIARVMACNPSMVILDEATSSIDTLTEQRVQKAFNKMMEGKTTFIVAHRLSTIENADMILVMNKGNVIEQGTHKELLDKKGFYCNLYNSQFAQD